MPASTILRNAVLLSLLAGAAGAVKPPAPTPKKIQPTEARRPYCAAEYADDLSSLAPRIRELEQRQPAYTWCLRSAAAYECPFYGSDGALRRTRKTVVAHGTGFAYQQQGPDTLLLTNQHVADWPAVTDEEHKVDDVPAGCRRVSDTLKLVDNESDAYEADDVPLARVVSDPQLDISVLRARAALPVIPWRIGRSAALRERNVVDVRGFPLGAFKATAVGKVISAFDHDDYKEWLHDDFVVDALLSPGNSGSPVLAISCRTGEFELVGVYHAAYTRGGALNVVVGIEQLSGLMTTLRRTTHPRADAPAVLDARSRATLGNRVRASLEPFFPFGSGTAALRLRGDGTLVYELQNRDFPFRTFPVVVMEDLASPVPGEFGALGRVWFGGAEGLKEYSRSELDGEAQGVVARLLEALRHDSQAAFAYQEVDRTTAASREQFDERSRLERSLRRTAASRQELAGQAADAAERLSPRPGEKSATLAEVMVGPQRSAAASRGAAPGEVPSTGAGKVSPAAQASPPPVQR
ncbi:MAG: S1 family peptidase [Myxococcaceae bacterium]